MSDIKDLLKTVRELEIKTKGLVDGIVSGSYKSKIRGRGIEFSEVREYAIGDDIRRIDWNVTARTKKLHVRSSLKKGICTYMSCLTILQVMNLALKKVKNRWVMRLRLQSYSLR